MNKKTLPLLLSLLVMLPIASCGDDEDDDEGGGALSVTFTASNSNPPANSISLQGASASGPAFTVNVNVTDVVDLYGASYTLTWSPGVLEYIGAANSGYFGAGDNFQVALENGAQGRLVVGHTRVGSVPGVTGSGTLHTLSFRAIAAGSTGVQFESVRLADSTGAVIANVQFFGGSASAQSQ